MGAIQKAQLSASSSCLGQQDGGNDPFVLHQDLPAEVQATAAAYFKHGPNPFNMLLGWDSGELLNNLDLDNLVAQVDEGYPSPVDSGSTVVRSSLPPVQLCEASSLVHNCCPVSFCSHYPR